MLPRVLAHGPLSYQGLNIPNLFTEQTTAHIETLLKYQDQLDDPTRVLLRATGEAMQLEMGLTGPLFEAPTLLKDLIMDSWMKHTWLSAVNYDIHLQLWLLDFPLQRVHDLKLVKLFLHNRIRQPQLRMLHQCCMYLNVLRLSDICNRTGNQIIQQCWTGLQLVTLMYSWPCTPKPDTADWQCWQITLMKLLHLGRWQMLATPLGNWHAPK